MQIHQTSYDQHHCQTGFVHLGFGAFHKAHQAVYLDNYMEQSGDLRWGIAAINLRADDAKAFADQNPRGYILKTTDSSDQHDYRMVRSHVEHADWSQEPESAENILARRSVHAMTITVTESGYYLKDDGVLDTSHAWIRQELSGGAACTIYGFLAQALHKRAQSIDQPLTIVCCDNFRNNGTVLKESFLKFLHDANQQNLHDWVQEKVSFPCSMVDRITPRTTLALQQEIATLMEPAACQKKPLHVVHCEAFTQWVIENNFMTPMPELQRVGVDIVNSVMPYEEAKICILNGGHAGLAYLAALAGYKTFDQAMNDPELRKHFDAWELKEVLPTLNAQLPFDKYAYFNQVCERFQNRAISDQLERICMDGYSKIPLYIKPTLEKCLQQGILPVHGFACVASWYVFARRFASGKTHLAYDDSYWERLVPLLQHGNEQTMARSCDLWYDLPERYPQFVPSLCAAIERMEQSWPE